jgi:hypothetical protein
MVVLKAVFSIIAWISILGGIVAIVLGLWTWDLGGLFSGLMGLLNGYAWGLLGDMWERLENAERKLREVGS